MTPPQPPNPPGLPDQGSDTLATGEFLLAANRGWQPVRLAPVDINGGCRGGRLQYEPPKTPALFRIPTAACF